MSEKIEMKILITLKLAYWREYWDEFWMHSSNASIEKARHDLLNLYCVLVSDNQKAYAIAKIQYLTKLLGDRNKQ